MSIVNTLLREAKFAARDRTILAWLFVVFSLSTLSVYFGLAEVQQQHSSIGQLIEADRQDRAANDYKSTNWGSAAYYNFQLTYDAPSDFAFAAIGQRDLQPWKHRIRMLALEGQIYERDTNNPAIAVIDRFDFAFLTAFIVPLVLIMLLYDLRAGERSAGRHNLLEACAGRGSRLWAMRTSVRVSALFLSLIIPLIIAALAAGTESGTLVSACLFVFIYTLIWAVVCHFIAAWRKPSTLVLMTLIGIWLAVAVIVPAGARLVINKAIPLPSGADILMLQRETVNDAWDLPQEITMDAFFEQYPEWADYKPVGDSFEWQWYYAFQQAGDRASEQLSTAYQEGRLQRDRIATWVSILTPPSLLERSLQRLANTDLRASIEYERDVRNYHAALRAFYYPRFFQNTPFDKTQLDEIPSFSGRD